MSITLFVIKVTVGAVTTAVVALGLVNRNNSITVPTLASYKMSKSFRETLLKKNRRKKQRQPGVKHRKKKSVSRQMTTKASLRNTN